MCIRDLIRLGLLSFLLLFGTHAQAQGFGLDASNSPEKLVQLLISDPGDLSHVGSKPGLPLLPGTWLRLRGMQSGNVLELLPDGTEREVALPPPLPPRPTEDTSTSEEDVPATSVTPAPLPPSPGPRPNAPSVAERRSALLQLRAAGYQIVAILRWGSTTWASGVRAGGGQRAPLDLREAYQRGFQLGYTYGDVLDAWEVENEPDITFFHDNPETFVAYHKAVYLGLEAGMDRRLGPTSLLPRAHILMAPLSLPPGPWFEAAVANDWLSYTDGFNYHYYGYAEDFTGTYRLFEKALHDLVGDGPACLAPTSPVRRLPVLLTEYGYGLVDGVDRNTTEGRLRQWRWFGEVYAQILALRIAAPMAFYLAPYYEQGINEFGLTVPAVASSSSLPAFSYSSGGEVFRLSDFGESVPQPWMNYIGRTIGPYEVTPALAQLWRMAETRPAGLSDQPFSIHVPPPSPVVMDLLAGEGSRAYKAVQGYHLRRRASTDRDYFSGGLTLVIYNFSTQTVIGSLDWTVSGFPQGTSPVLTLAPMERLELPLQARVPADRYRASPLQIRFNPKTLPPARLSTQLYPESDFIFSRTVDRVEFTAENTRANQQARDRLPVAREELVPTQTSGLWRLTEGLRVEETADHWIFHIDHFPDVALRPASAELPLPEGLRFAEDDFPYLRFRITQTGQPTTETEPDVRYRSRTGKLYSFFDAGYIMSNGNVCTLWPRLPATFHWREWMYPWFAYTPFYYSRAALPWRREDNRPLVLRLNFRPDTLPATYEVTKLALIRLGEKAKEEAARAPKP